jgi:hypothetical protein
MVVKIIRPLWLLSLGWTLVVVALVLLLGRLPLHAGPELRFQSVQIIFAIAEVLFFTSLISSMFRQDWKKHPFAFFAIVFLNLLPLTAAAFFIWLCFNFVI